MTNTNFSVALIWRGAWQQNRKTRRPPFHTAADRAQGDASSFHWLVVRQPHVDYGARATTGDAGDWDIKQSIA
jgi:hypothetical protein